MTPASGRTVTALERIVSNALDAHDVAGKRLLVAVSGGPDSLALLHTLWRLRSEHRLTLCGAHLNHKLRGTESDADAEFVEESFRQLGIDYTVDSADVAGYRRRHRLSLEDAARQVRYSFLARASADHGADAVALGHTADDQAETVLMHIIRGSGLDGLRGMQPYDRRCVDGRRVSLFRPLLDVSRAETQAFCQALDLEPRVDASNSSPEFLRNRVRLELVPLLEQMNPSIQAALIRLAGNATQESDFIRAHADEVWDEVASASFSESGDTVVFDTDRMRTQHRAIQSRLLRRGINDLGGEAGRQHILRMMRLIDGGPGKTLDLPGRLTFATDYGRALLGATGAVQSELSALPALEVEHAISVPGETVAGEWLVQTSVRAHSGGSAAGGVVQVRRDGKGDSEYMPHASEVLDMDCVGEGLRIRGRKPGDRFQPLGMEQSKSLREFMIDARIPRRWRDGLPLVVSSRGIACVPGWRIAHWARVTDATERVLRIGFTHCSR